MWEDLEFTGQADPQHGNSWQHFFFLKSKTKQKQHILGKEEEADINFPTTTKKHMAYKETKSMANSKQKTTTKATKIISEKRPDVGPTRESL